MFVIDNDKTIHLTRGDIAPLEISIEKENGEAYIFREGNVVRLAVYGKKDCDNIYLQKDVAVSGSTSVVDMFLVEDDTKIGEPISKPKDYWYEVVLNPETAPQTIIGYDKDGPKVLKLYPEGGDVNEA